MKKKVSKRPEDGLLTELISGLMEIQSETDYCAFFRYSGHVDSITLHITESKRRYQDTIFERCMYLDRPESAENLRKCITEIKNREF
jgi:hypothetical protein